MITEDMVDQEASMPRSSRSRRKSWSYCREDSLEEAYAYLLSYPFLQHPEYRQRLEEELDSYIGLLFWIAYECIQDTELTHDCVMDALKSACSRIQCYTPEQVGQLQVLPWVKTIVRNKAITIHKKQHQTESLESLMEKQGAEDSFWYPISREQIAQQPEIVLLQQDACRRLAEVFSLLPERQAQAIRAHFLDEHGHRIIAERFGISEKGANMLSSRGLKKMREVAHRLGLRANDFYLGDFDGVLTQFLTGTQDSA